MMRSVHTVRVRLVGELQVDGCPPSSFPRRQVRTLLRVLALNHGRPVSVEHLAQCLWGDHPPAHPADQIAVLASRLRGVIGGDRITRNDGGYTLTLDWLDVDAIELYLAESEQRLGTGAAGAARTAAAAGLALIRGPLLADEPDPWWAEVERAHVTRVTAELHRVGARAALATGDPRGAADLAERALAADPYDEAALRLLMEGLVASGRPASALAAYAETRHRLAEDLGVSPSHETEALHEAILGTEVAGLGGEARASRGRELPGRSDALATLDGLLEGARRGEGRVAVIEGEAGMGKSTLLEWWVAGVPDAGVVSAACDELGRALPLQPVLDVIARLVEQGDPDEMLGPDGPVLGPLIGVHTAGSPALPSPQLAALTDPGAGTALLFAATFSVIRRRARQQPLVVTIDDAHLAGPSTAAWLAQAVRRLSDARVLVVAAQREEEGEPIPGAARVGLGPLDVAAAALVVGEARAQELHARSGGHPLFLVELGAADDASLPSNIRQAVEERCRRAGEAGPTLRAAAVLGPTVDLDLLAEVTGIAPPVLLDQLEEGVRRRFLIEEGPGLAFTHTLVRESLAASVSATRAAFIHRQAGRALAARGDADPLEVSLHARLGGDRALAAATLVAAARLAVERMTEEEAIGLLDDAIELTDSVAARLERARVLSMLGRYDDALNDIAAARGAGAGAEALEVEAWAAHFRRQFDRALALADRGAETASDPEVRMSCLALAGWVSLAAGDPPGAETRLTGALDQSFDGTGQLAETWLAWLRMNQGRPEEAIRLVHPASGRGLAAYRLPNAYALMAATMAHAMLGRPDEALADASTLERAVERMGARRWGPRPLNLRAWIVRNLGAASEADELNTRAIELATDLDLAEPAANGLLDLAAGRLDAGDLDGACALLDRVETTCGAPHAFRWRHQLRARLLRARLDLAAGRVEGALEGATTLADDAAGLQAVRCEVQARLTAALAGHALGEAGDPDHVEALLERLGGVAGLEAWWLTAAAARAFGNPRWADLAQRRVATLLGRAGPYAGTLERAAGARLG